LVLANFSISRWSATYPASSSYLENPDDAYFDRMIDWASCDAVEQNPERYSGAWLFRATRVPVATLFENLEDDARSISC